MKQIRLLLSAYACEPQKGSEPGLGWDLAVHLASRVEVHVVTRENNREAIEQALACLPADKRPTFYYFDCAPPDLQVKKALKAHRWYYQKWQKNVRPLVERIIREQNIDVAHHVTFASFRYPTAIEGVQIPTIWGPVGGAEQTPWSLLPWHHPKELAYELVRNCSNAISQMALPGRAKRWGEYSAIYASTEETRHLFQKFGFSVKLMPAVALPEHIFPAAAAREERDAQQPLKLLYVGNLSYLKGIHWAIAALEQQPHAVLTIVGTGGFKSNLLKIAQNRGVANRVSFKGRVPRASLGAIYADHDVFVFPSLHDSGGMAVLEAMSMGMPIIALQCGGPALAVDERSGILVPPISARAIREGLVSAIQVYQANPLLCLQHGRAAQERVQRYYSWPGKIEAFLQTYREVISQHRPNG